MRMMVRTTLLRRRLSFKVDQETLQEKNVYYQKKKTIAIVDASYCNKIWSNKFVQQKISLQ